MFFVVVDPVLQQNSYLFNISHVISPNRIEFYQADFFPCPSAERQIDLSPEEIYTPENRPDNFPRSFKQGGDGNSLLDHIQSGHVFEHDLFLSFLLDDNTHLTHIFPRL